MRLLVEGGQTKKEGTPSFHFQCIAHPGACDQTRVVPHDYQPTPKLWNAEARNACVVVSPLGRMGMRKR
jgi:hypothetical protein